VVFPDPKARTLKAVKTDRSPRPAAITQGFCEGKPPHGFKYREFSWPKPPPKSWLRPCAPTWPGARPVPPLPPPPKPQTARNPRKTRPPPARPRPLPAPNPHDGLAPAKSLLPYPLAIVGGLPP
jgi:hypothetical protein